jgi:hypothetical protein
MKPKINPKSLKNLTHEGRPTVYEQKKTTHNITVTPAGWEGLQAKAHSLGYSGVSEFVEQVGRGQVHVEKKSFDGSQTHSLANVNYEDIKMLFQASLQVSELRTIEYLRNSVDEQFKNFLSEVRKIILEGIMR